MKGKALCGISEKRIDSHASTQKAARIERIIQVNEDIHYTVSYESGASQSPAPPKLWHKMNARLTCASNKTLKHASTVEEFLKMQI